MFFFAFVSFLVKQIVSTIRSVNRSNHELLVKLIPMESGVKPDEPIVKQSTNTDPQAPPPVTAPVLTPPPTILGSADTGAVTGPISVASFDLSSPPSTVSTAIPNHFDPIQQQPPAASTLSFDSLHIHEYHLSEQLPHLARSSTVLLSQGEVKLASRIIFYLRQHPASVLNMARVASFEVCIMYSFDPLPKSALIQTFVLFLFRNPWNCHVCLSTAFILNGPPMSRYSRYSMSPIPNCSCSS